MRYRLQIGCKENIVATKDMNNEHGWQNFMHLILKCLLALIGGRSSPSGKLDCFRVTRDNLHKTVYYLSPAPELPKIIFKKNVYFFKPSSRVIRDNLNKTVHYLFPAPELPEILLTKLYINDIYPQLQSYER